MGGWEIFTRNGGEARNGGISFIMGGWTIFKVSYPVILWTPPILPTPTPLCPHTPPPTLHPHFPATTNSHPHCFFLLSCFFDWMGDYATFDALFYLMASLGTLVPEGPWCVFHATRRQVYLSLTHCGFLLVLWFDINHTQHTQHTQGPVD